MPAADPRADLVQALHDLGFSQYEARCYVGLLHHEPQTGYAVAKATGVPQPKVYEALRKLVSRGAAHEVAGTPVRFLPTPPGRLLDDLEAGVSSRLDEARDAASHLTDDGVAAGEVLGVSEGWDAAALAAQRVIAGAVRRIYVSASASHLGELEQALREALDRDVDVVVLAFGAMPFVDERLRVFRHASTEGVIYRSHQARHLAVIVDSSSAVWALANDGHTWGSIESTNELVIAALKGFIRHDIDMQQVFDDFGPLLVEKYGPGLEALERYRQVQPEAAVEPASRVRAKRAR